MTEFQIGCQDPADRIAAAKANDPERLKLIAIFEAWFEAHGDSLVTYKTLDLSVAGIIDPSVAMETDPDRSNWQAIREYLRKLDGNRTGEYAFVAREPLKSRDPKQYQVVKIAGI